MLPYWVIYLLPSFFLFFNFKYSKKIKLSFWYFFLLILTLFLGLRHEVGGDWYQYVIIYEENFKNFEFYNINLRSDYLYGLFNYIFGLFFKKIYALNLFFSLFFILSLNFYLDKKDDYLLAMIGSLPFFIYVVGMGFTRQTVSISFMLIILRILPLNKYFYSLFFSILAIGFHKSFLIFNLVLILFSKKNIFLMTLIIFISIIIFIAGYNNFIRLYYYYSGDGIHFASYGVMYRIFINLIFATIFLIFKEKLTNNNNEKLLYTIISIFVFLSCFFVIDYSSLIDRINFYFIPIQLFVLLRMNRLFINKQNYLFAKLIIFLFYSFILFIWMNFAIHKIGWLPYSNLLFI